MLDPAINTTCATQCKESPFSETTVTPLTQAKAFSRKVDLVSDNISPDVESRIHAFFNNQLLAANVPKGQAKALRDFIIVQLNNYLTLTMHQPDLAVAIPTTDQKSNTNPPLTETGTLPPDDAPPPDKENYQQSLCRQLVHLKDTVTSGKLGLDNDNIMKYLKQQLPKKTYQHFKSILREQPKTEKNGGNVDTTSRMINTALIIGSEVYEHFFNALTNCGYHGLFQSEIYPEAKTGSLDSFLSRSNTLPARFGRHRSRPGLQQQPSPPDYAPEPCRSYQQAQSQLVIEGPKLIQQSNDQSVVPIRIKSNFLVREVEPSALQSFRPPTPPTRNPVGAERLTAKSLAAEIQRRDFLPVKTIAVRKPHQQDACSRFLPPPPAEWIAEEDES